MMSKVFWEFSAMAKKSRLSQMQVCAYAPKKISVAVGCLNLRSSAAPWCRAKLEIWEIAKDSLLNCELRATPSSGEMPRHQEATLPGAKWHID
jgi:hypothetical protein